MPRGHEIVGSNPTTLTENSCGGVRAGTGRRLLTVTTQVRFLSPQLDEWKSSGWKQGLPPSDSEDAVGPHSSSYFWVGSSAAEQVFVKHPRVGSSPTRPSFIAG